MQHDDVVMIVDVIRSMDKTLVWIGFTLVGLSIILVTK